MNEYVGFVFFIRPASAIAQPTLHVEIGSASPTIAVELDRVHPIHVDHFPGWHVRAIPPSLRDYDPLDVVVPLDSLQGGMPAKLEPGKVYYFWFEAMADRGTPAATFKLPIVLQSGSKSVGTLEVELRVWPIVLPEDNELMALGELDHVGLFRHHVPQASNLITSATAWNDLPQREDYNRVLRETIRMLHKHRLAALLPDLRPAVKVSPRGGLDVDWSNYDRITAPLLDGTAFENRIGSPVWPLPLRSFVRPDADKRFEGAGTEFLVKQFVEECAAHFKQRGWLKRSFANTDDPDDFDSDSLISAEKANGIVREVDKEILMASRRFPQSMKPFGWSDFPTGRVPPADIWIPDAQFYDPGSMSAERAAGRQTWLAVDRPPFSGTAELTARASDTLVMSWQAKLLGARYLWLGLVNGWPSDPSASGPSQCARFDPHALVFPGTSFGLKVPVPTMRLKRVRETMQQAAYVKLLEQYDRGHIGDALGRGLVEYAGTGAYRTIFADGRPIGWTDNAERFEAARQIMAAEILERTPERKSGADEHADLASSLTWRSFMTTAPGVRVRVDGTRIRVAGTPSDSRVQVETSFTVSNQEREPLRAKAILANVPETCIPSEGEQALDVPVGSSHRFVMALTCKPEWLGSQKRDFQLELSRREHQPFLTQVHVSCLVAEPTERPLIIDGDLSDWVPAAGNVASDFSLIAGECDNGQQFCAQPALRTFAFVRRDTTFLYVGINTESQGEGPSMRRREVPYDDLIPDDVEDLVEVLIDPLNAGTRNPSDLYHVVVKRSGIYLAERGITTTPPIGPRRVWNAEIDVASRTGQRRWTAEIRIPLSAFDRPGSVNGEIWGFNVTHYHAARQEFSTWSGAAGNAYDPLTLGNLFLP